MGNDELMNEGQGEAGGQNGSTLLTGDEVKPSASETGTGTEAGTGTDSTDPSAQTATSPKSEPQLPEKYELTTPEGVELDTAFLEQVTPVFKELKLSGVQAQKLADLYTGKVVEMQRAQMDTWNKTLSGWQASAMNDAEYGGAGFEENVSLAKAALKEFGSDDLQKAFIDYGMGNHPEVIRLLYKVGKAMKNDKLVVGDRNGSVDPNKALYPNMA